MAGRKTLSFLNIRSLSGSNPSRNRVVLSLSRTGGIFVPVRHDRFRFFRIKVRAVSHGCSFHITIDWAYHLVNIGQSLGLPHVSMLVLSQPCALHFCHLRISLIPRRPNHWRCGRRTTRGRQAFPGFHLQVRLYPLSPRRDQLPPLAVPPAASAPIAMALATSRETAPKSAIKSGDTPRSLNLQSLE